MKQDWTDKLRDKMDSYTESPSDKVWAGINASQNTAWYRRSKWLWTLPAAAAIAAVAVLMIPESDDIGLTADASKAQVNAKVTAAPETLIVNAENTEKASPALEQTSPYSLKEERKGTWTAMKTASAEMQKSDNIGTNSMGSEIVETALIDIEPKQALECEVKEQAKEDEPKDESEAWARIMAEEQEELRRARKGHFSTGISVTGAAGGNSEESRPTNAILGANPLEAGVSGADWTSATFSKDNGQLVYNQAEIETEYNHKIPVKIGLSTRYNFSRRFGLESGITYSLLSSDLQTGKSTDKGWSKGEQTIHYLGVPLTLSFDILNSKWVNVYISAGGMLEKAIKGDLDTDEYLDGRLIGSHHTNITPKEFQWSVNVAAGLQVNMLPNLGLFVEPGISHRFHTRSAIRTIYTDKPTDFSLGFGIRFSFE